MCTIDRMLIRLSTLQVALNRAVVVTSRATDAAERARHHAASVGTVRSVHHLDSVITLLHEIAALITEAAERSKALLLLLNGLPHGGRRRGTPR